MIIITFLNTKQNYNTPTIDSGFVSDEQHEQQVAQQQQQQQHAAGKFLSVDIPIGAPLSSMIVRVKSKILFFII